MNGDRKEIMKRHGISISIATVATWISIVPAFWFLVKPVLVSSVSAAVTDDIREQVESQVRPLNSAFKVILKNQIDRLRIDISILQSRQDSGEWTAEDARLLEEKKIELDDLQAAYREL